jgi:hypothetical protein
MRNVMKFCSVVNKIWPYLSSYSNHFHGNDGNVEHSTFGEYIIWKTNIDQQWNKQQKRDPNLNFC